MAHLGGPGLTVALVGRPSAGHLAECGLSRETAALVDPAGDVAAVLGGIALAMPRVVAFDGPEAARAPAEARGRPEPGEGPLSWPVLGLPAYVLPPSASAEPAAWRALGEWVEPLVGAPRREPESLLFDEVVAVLRAWEGRTVVLLDPGANRNPGSRPYRGVLAHDGEHSSNDAALFSVPTAPEAPGRVNPGGSVVALPRDLFAGARWAGGDPGAGLIVSLGESRISVHLEPEA